MTAATLTHFAACVRNIAELARDRDPLEITDLLNEYKTVMLAAVEAEQGFFSGALADQAAACWGGLPSQTPRQSALHACRAALNLLGALDADARLGPLGLRVDIGIADEEELSVALCKLCRTTGASILVGGPTRELCAQALSFEEIEPIKDAAGKSMKVFRLK